MEWRETVVANLRERQTDACRSAAVQTLRAAFRPERPLREVLAELAGDERLWSGFLAMTLDDLRDAIAPGSRAWVARPVGPPGRARGPLPSVARGMVARYVAEHPGCTRTDLRRVLGLGAEVLKWQLRTLRRLGALRVEGSDSHYRYYPAG